MLLLVNEVPDGGEEEEKRGGGAHRLHEVAGILEVR